MHNGSGNDTSLTARNTGSDSSEWWLSHAGHPAPEGRNIHLNKHNCNAALAGVNNYLSHINNAFGAQFESMKKYKEEANFKRCLEQLQLEDVVTAILRAKTIMQRNERDGYPLTRFKGYAYYLHNPSLELWQPIEQILNDCGII